MNLGENKKITLGLIEEYSPVNPLLTDDEDISTRLNFVYATNYQDLSEKKKILKTKTIKEIIENEDELIAGYTEYSLPSNMYQLKSVFAFDESGNKANADYYIVGKKIYIENLSNFKYVIEYYMYPTVITKDTPDSFVLEIDQDVQMILPYMVASDVLKTDPSADYTAFEKEYNRRLNDLNVSLSTPRATAVQHYKL